MTIDMHIEIDANYYVAMDAGLRGLACYEDRSWTVEYLSASGNLLPALNHYNICLSFF